MNLLLPNGTDDSFIKLIFSNPLYLVGDLPLNTLLIFFTLVSEKSLTWLNPPFFSLELFLSSVDANFVSTVLPFLNEIAFFFN